MGFRQKDVQEASLEENKLKSKEMVMKRERTDCLCCLFFILFICLMIAISIFGAVRGDITRILVPFDSDGNECGQPG